MLCDHLTFADVTGSRMTRADWLRRFRDPDYGVLWRKASEGWEVEASWVGCASTRESMPGFFLVRSWDVYWDSKKDRRIRAERGNGEWFATAQEAIDAAKSLARKLTTEAA